MGAKPSKMIGCRVVDDLDRAIRKRADGEGRSVNDVMVEILGDAFKGEPVDKAHFENKTEEIIQKIQEHKKRVAELEEADDSFFGDVDIRVCIKALKIEIKELIEALPKSKEEEEGWF